MLRAFMSWQANGATGVCELGKGAILLSAFLLQEQDDEGDGGG